MNVPFGDIRSIILGDSRLTRITRVSCHPIQNTCLTYNSADPMGLSVYWFLELSEPILVRSPTAGAKNCAVDRRRMTNRLAGVIRRDSGIQMPGTERLIKKTAGNLEGFLVLKSYSYLIINKVDIGVDAYIDTCFRFFFRPAVQMAKSYM